MTENTTGMGSPGAGPRNGVGAAADAFASLLDSRDEENTQDEQEANPEDEIDESAELEASDEDEQDEIEESETEDTEEDESEESADQLFTVTIDGKEEKVTLDELRDGYFRTADYTRKTQALAEERKAAEAELESVRAERAEYAQLLPKLRTTFEAGMGPEPDWNTLRQQDPARAAVLWQQREEQRRHIEQLKAEEQRVLQEQERDAQRQAQAYAEEQRNLLLDKLPEWKDAKVANSEAAGIKKMLADAGFPPEQQVIGDHRYVMIARKALLYDQMMEKRKGLDKKRAGAPVVKPGGGVPKSKNAATRQYDQLRKTGSVKDAANLFANLL